MQSQQAPKTMKPMLSHRRTRFTAMVMLLVWLLTLGAGIANACLLHDDHATTGDARSPVAQESQAATSGIDSRVAPHGVAAAAVEQREGDELLESFSCQTQCLTVQTTVPKQQPLACADPGTDPVLVTSTGPVRQLAHPVPVLAGIAFAPRPETPVFIRFLRLTL